MRISDWSSDVCSSDLRCPQVLRFKARCGPLLPRHNDSKRQPWRQPVRENWWQGLSARRGPAPGHTTPSSEEHTSELQSLMRISYAVFCLKTKKDNYHLFNTTYNT